jgi:hypothetical protein
MGFSTGEWHGDDLVVKTSHIKAEYLRREGIPYSDKLTVEEHWLRHGNTITHVMIATDPIYLTEPMINTEEFVMMDRSNTNWLYNCETAEEVPRLKHQVPTSSTESAPHATPFGRPPAGSGARRCGDDDPGIATSYENDAGPMSITRRATLSGSRALPPRCRGCWRQICRAGAVHRHQPRLKMTNGPVKTVHVSACLRAHRRRQRRLLGGMKAFSS